MALRINRIRFKDFKSFRKANIPLHDGFTAIAGANASGKSNIFDGLLFVMGVTSLKLLRASRLTDLVNHSSTDGYAKVEIDLTDAEKEYTFARIIDKQGKSIYRINGKRRTLNEVSELLLSLGLTPLGQNFVVQGDITKIIEMNDKQRRELIDEIAGLQEFEEKKQESLKKLEAVEKKIKDTELVLKERENYLNELEKEKLAAEKFTQLKEELSSCKATILADEITRIKIELKNADSKRNSLKESIEKKEKEQNDLKEELKKTNEKLEEITDKLISSSRETFSGAGKKVEELKAGLRYSKERINSKEAALKAIEAKKSFLFDKRKSLNSSSLALKEREKKLTEELKESQENYAKISEAVSAKSGKANEFSKKIYALQEELKELNKLIAEKKDSLYEVNSAFNSLEKEISLMQEKLNELNEEKKELKEKLIQRDKIAVELNSFKAHNFEKELEKIFEEINSASDNASAKNALIDSLNESITHLKKSLSLCPVCDSELKEEKKKSLLSKKEKELIEAEKDVKKFISLKKELNEKRKSLEEKINAMNELKFKLNGFIHFEKQLNETERRIKETSLSEKKISLEELRKKKKEISEKVSSLAGKANLTESKLDDLKKTGSIEEFSKLQEKENELNEKISSMKVELAEIRTEMNKGIANEINAIDSELENSEKGLIQVKEEVKKLNEEVAVSEKELIENEKELEAQAKANKLLEEEKHRLATKTGNLEEKKSSCESKLDLLEKELNEFNLNNSKNEVRIIDLEEEFKSFELVPLIKGKQVTELKSRIPVIEKEIDSLGAINMRAIEGFEEFKKEVSDVREKAEKLDSERKSILELIDKIDVRKLNIFMECFNAINLKFKELYSTFLNGEGKLELTDAVNPVEGGLTIQAKYEGETMKHLNAMSGGEKSMTALAFLFAIQSFNPAPVYVFDEADAALDKENSVKMGRIIKEISRHSQFISISHNDSIIKMADQIIGVALNKQKSSVIGLRLKGKLEEQRNEKESKEDEEELNEKETDSEEEIELNETEKNESALNE
ncbi:MAG: AAA family ATPase [Candidatus Diapherotrites archaeon]|nr:AAA family ATPase [Candidatus Diapherotrites archaeon]